MFDHSSARLEPAADDTVVDPLSGARTAVPDRRALRIVQLGAVAVVLVATLYRSFELDRFFVPKELVLHITALCAAGLLFRSLRRAEYVLIDVLLVVFLLLGVVSTGFASNHWYALRALAVTASGLLLFWAARMLAMAGARRALLGAVALAVVLGCITSLLQAYGVRTDLFSINRSPGGTLGNRNFVAHMAAFGLPVILLAALSAQHWLRYTAAAFGAALVTATLILTRSRAGLLAFAAVLTVFLAAAVLAPALRRSVPLWRRLAGMAVLGAAAVAAVVVLPNQLRWRSANPYLESIAGVANFQEGSGRGRLVQYRRTFTLSLQHPVLGAGPGNWTVEYPAVAAPRDPSLDTRQGGLTANPWPSSDWFAFLAERGFLAATIIIVGLLGIALSGWRHLRETVDAGDALRAATLLATLGATVVAGAFDAVLLLALPMLLIATALGALYSPPARRVQLPPALRAALFTLTLLLTAIGALRSSAQLTVMALYDNVRSTTWLSRATLIDPANYRLRIRLARAGSGLDRDTRCRHARAAHALLPHAHEARNLERRCRN